MCSTSHGLSKQAKSNARDGTVTVEMAIIAPFVFLLIFGAVEFGRLNILRHAVSNAAYEAARHGMVPGATAAEMTAHAEQHLSAVSASGATVQVTPATVDEQTDTVTVQVSVPMDQNSWITPMFTSGSQIEGTCTLQTERYRGN
jgi:Flp pilus assembly protein TadG